MTEISEVKFNETTFRVGDYVTAFFNDPGYVCGEGVVWTIASFRAASNYERHRSLCRAPTGFVAELLPVYVPFKFVGVDEEQRNRKRVESRPVSVELLQPVVLLDILNERAKLDALARDFLAKVAASASSPESGEGI